MNHKRVYRLYVEEKLGLRRKRGRRRMPTTAARVPLKLPVRSDEVWTTYFTGSDHHNQHANTHT